MSRFHQQYRDFDGGGYFENENHHPRMRPNERYPMEFQGAPHRSDMEFRTPQQGRSRTWDSYYDGPDQYRDNRERQNNQHGPYSFDTGYHGPRQDHMTQDNYGYDNVVHDDHRPRQDQMAQDNKQRQDSRNDKIPQGAQGQRSTGNIQPRNKQDRNLDTNEQNKTSDFPGISVNKRTADVFQMATVEASSGEARHEIGKIARAVQKMGQKALDMSLARHIIRTAIARNGTDVMNRGYDLTRLAIDIARKVKDYTDEELISVLNPINEEAIYITEQYQMEKEVIAEFIQKMTQQREAREDRLLLPEYNSWSNQTKAQTTRMSKGQKSTESKTSYAEAAKPKIKEPQRATGATPKKTKTPSKTDEDSENNDSSKTVGVDTENEEKGVWIQPKEQRRQKRRQTERNKKAEKDVTAQRPQVSTDIRADGIYNRDGKKIEEVTISSADEQNRRQPGLKADSDSDKDTTDQEEDVKEIGNAPPQIKKKK